MIASDLFSSNATDTAFNVPSAYSGPCLDGNRPGFPRRALFNPHDRASAGSGADDGLRDYPKANGVDTKFIFRDMENDRSLMPRYVVEIEALKPDPAAPMLSKRNPTGYGDPGDIPIEALSRFSFAVDMETAHKLKVYPPMEILRFAHFIKTGADS